MQIFSILFFSVVLEGLVEWIKTIYDKGRFNWQHLIALAAGITTAFAANLDFFAAAEMPLAWPVAGKIFTGLFLARGSNYMHSLLDMVNSRKTGESDK